MKLEQAARFVEIVGQLDALAAELRADDACTCSALGAHVLSHEACALSRRMTPFVFAHASGEDAQALGALIAQLRTT